MFTLAKADVGRLRLRPFTNLKVVCNQAANVIWKGSETWERVKLKQNKV